MRRSSDRPFLELDDSELADRAEAAGIASTYRAGVLENLRTLQAHAKRVADALAADVTDAAASRPSRP